MSNKAELKLKRLYSKIRKGFSPNEDTQTAIARTWFKAERKRAVKHLLTTSPRLCIRNFSKKSPYCPFSQHDKIYQVLEIVETYVIGDSEVQLRATVPTKGKGNTYSFGDTLLLSLSLEREGEVMAERPVCVNRKTNPNPRTLFADMIEQAAPMYVGKVQLDDGTAATIESYLNSFSILRGSDE